MEDFKIWVLEHLTINLVIRILNKIMSFSIKLIMEIQIQVDTLRKEVQLFIIGQQ